MPLKNWIKSAVKKPGQLHKDLGIPKDKKIPSDMLHDAAKQPGKTGQRARLAIAFKGMKK